MRTIRTMIIVAMLTIGMIAVTPGGANAIPNVPQAPPHKIQPIFKNTRVDITIYIANDAPPPNVVVINASTRAPVTTAHYDGLAAKSGYRYDATIKGVGSFDLTVTGTKSKMSPNCCYSIGWGGNDAGPVTITLSSPATIRMSSREQLLH